MIDHNRPTLGEEESRAAERVLRSGWVAQGSEVEAFEREFCAFLGLPEGHALAVSSGTAALFLALWALDARGKRVLLPGYACSALRHAGAMAGAKESLADVSEDSPNLDIGALASSGADIAVIAHMYGLPADIAGLDIPVVEDCAQALGAAVGGVPVGLRGRAGIFSFYATKLITTGGQGGMVVSTSRALADAVRDYREFDRREDRKVRFNFQMTDLQAAIGRVQLARLPGFLEARSRTFESYREAGLDLLDVRPRDKARCRPVRYRAVLKTASPEKALKALRKAGIGAIIPIQDWELLGPPDALPRAAELARKTVSLPIYPTLPEGTIGRAAEALRET